MKRLLLVLLIGIPIVSHAQFTKGSYLLQAGFNLKTFTNIQSNSSGSTTTSNTVNLNNARLSISRFYKQNSAFEFMVMASVNNDDFTGLNNNYMAGAGIGHLVMKPLGEHWGAVFVSEMYAMKGRAKRNTRSPYSMDLFSAGASFVPGVYVILHERFLLKAGINLINITALRSKNDPDITGKNKYRELQSLRLDGFIPGTITFSGIQFSLGVLINKP